ncbi:hypothetical protein [Salipiger bermudensis]|uniref:hypothetical protein n=1 Tax=Salipiger bermudensis TaxID=344736 RepID=UPI00300840C2
MDQRFAARAPTVSGEGICVNLSEIVQLLRWRLPFVNLVRETLSMRHEWIIDVLTDLRGYARANALEALAEQLADAQAVAEVELASSAGERGIGTSGQGTGSGRVYRPA